jgi:UPF0755 protein
MAYSKTFKRRSAQGGRRWLLPLLLLLASAVPVAWVYFSLFTPLPIPAAGYRLDIGRGSTMRQLTSRMSDDGILPNGLLPRLWVRLHPALGRIRPGAYLVQGPLTTVELLQKLGTLDPINRLTVVEGSTFRELLEALAARQDVEHTLSGKSDAEIMAALGVREGRPEGLFAPDTYDVAPGDSDLATLKRLYLHQQKIMADEWTARAPKLPYRSPYEALIMASIIEKETGAAAERPQIAGVFVRRLQTGMRLQTDPTVIYGMGDLYRGKLAHDDLLQPTPYNTYQIDGLPPTPIALPGQAAIHAALHPAPGDALYFVARGDGSHQFSATLAEHNRAVQQFQLHRVQDYRSAPARRDAGHSQG